MQTLVKDILLRKGDKFIAVEASATVFEAITIMATYKVGAVFIVDGPGLVGVFTERDYLRRIVLQGRTSKETLVRDAMTSEVYFVTPQTTVQQCMVMMTEKRCRHLPVLVDGKQAGVISIGDCVKQMSADAHAQIEVLTDYIVNKYPV